MPISHRFEAGADVYSTEHRVGLLSPPLLESGWTDFDAVCFVAYPDEGPVTLRRNRVSVCRRLSAILERYRQTTDDRQACGNTDYWLASQESAKMILLQMMSFHSYTNNICTGLEHQMNIDLP